MLAYNHFASLRKKEFPDVFTKTKKIGFIYMQSLCISDDGAASSDGAASLGHSLPRGGKNYQGGKLIDQKITGTLVHGKEFLNRSYRNVTGDANLQVGLAPGFVVPLISLPKLTVVPKMPATWQLDFGQSWLNAAS